MPSCTSTGLHCWVHTGAGSVGVASARLACIGRCVGRAVVNGPEGNSALGTVVDFICASLAGGIDELGILCLETCQARSRGFRSLSSQFLVHAKRLQGCHVVVQANDCGQLGWDLACRCTGLTGRDLLARIVVLRGVTGAVVAAGAQSAALGGCCVDSHSDVCPGSRGAA